jgi:hypothetical protein
VKERDLRRFGAVMSALILSIVVCLTAACPGWPDCQPFTVGVDTSKATSSTATVLGDASLRSSMRPTR